MGAGDLQQVKVACVLDLCIQAVSSRHCNSVLVSKVLFY
jgi:hypothetical protein